MKIVGNKYDLLNFLSKNLLLPDLNPYSDLTNDNKEYKIFLFVLKKIRY